jgi:hypothetical protein
VRIPLLRDDVRKVFSRVRSGIQNFMHPRTDAVVIVAVISFSGDRILLGRNVGFVYAIYSLRLSSKFRKGFRNVSRRSNAMLKVKLSVKHCTRLWLASLSLVKHWRKL